MTLSGNRKNNKTFLKDLKMMYGSNFAYMKHRMDIVDLSKYNVISNLSILVMGKSVIHC